MGIRVRKLARELRRTPGDVLVLLQELGYERYRTAEDMVSDNVAARIRKASTQSAPRAIHLTPSQSSCPSKRAAAPPVPHGASDPMAALVPGVTPASVSSKHNGASADRGRAGSGDRAALEQARRELESERAALAAERAELAEARSALELERHTLETARAAVETERAAVDAARAALATEQALVHDRPHATTSDASADGPPSMMDMFDGRGLRGVDEAERALAALAGAKAMGRLLEQVKVREPDALRRLLWERLVLVGGPDVPEELDVPSVIVSQERADIPGAFELSRRCAALGEQLMLHGLVRVVMVGIAKRWHSLLRTRMDPRINLGFRPGPIHAGSLVPSSDPRRLALASPGAESGVADPAGGVDAPVDALLVWTQGGENPEPLPVLKGTRTRVVHVPASDLASWLEAAASAVGEGATA